MNNGSEHSWIEKCLITIEEKLDWGPSAQWHNDVFIELSEKIQKETQVLLSPTTLKRVWGRVKYQSQPSISTLNTLAQFAGFANWRDFKNQEPVKTPSWFERNVNPNLRIIVLSASVLTVVFISLYSMFLGDTDPVVIDPASITFSSRPITDGIPNSVVFDLNIDNVFSDSIHIQQYWDPAKTILLKPGQKQATGIYYYPGYFRAKLLVDGKIIKEHDLFIKSNGWLGTIDFEPIPKYIQETAQNGTSLSLPESALKEIRSNPDPITSSYHYVQDGDRVSGDHFVLETSIKNTYSDKWAVCQQARIVILGTKSAMIIPFSIAGCASEMGVMLSDVYHSGKEHDLSALCTDLSSFKNIKIEVINKQVSVYIEGNKVFTSSYTETLGDIAGMRYRFLGAGEVQSISLKNLTETTTFLDQTFSK